MVIFQRRIENRIKELLFKKRAILIFGPRQAGKTTLAKKLLVEYSSEDSYFNCETISVRKHFIVGDPTALKSLVGERKMVVFDEAQSIQNIGVILKVFIDSYPDVQIIATGSSSFDLANKINEPLTGRTFEFILYPLSLDEIKSSISVNKEDLYNLFRLGTYPAIVGEPSVVTKENLLKNIVTNYLYKDIFIFESIRNPKVFEDLLKMLAFQIGSLVSVNELSNSLGVSRATVDKYLRLLEQSYIIKRVYSFSRNKRDELKKAFKIYFLDLGVRNAVADLMEGNISERSDKGALLENFFFLERLKSGAVEAFPSKIYFWRTSTKLEIDFIETHNQTIKAYECKWKKENVSFEQFKKNYSDALTEVITPESLLYVQ